MIDEGALVRPLLAISTSSDGGLILDLSRSTPVSPFRYGVLDIPAGVGSWTAPIREQEASWSVLHPPKLHYHRSGLISLDATAILERQAIQATPLGDIGPNQKHCFTFVARHPLGWRTVAKRPADLLFELSQEPTTITIAGFVGPIGNLTQDTQPQNPWAIMVEEEDGSVVPTVVARLEMADPSYYVWLKLFSDRPYGEGDEPMVMLYAFDPDMAADPETPTPMLAVWSVPEAEATFAPSM